MPLSMISRNGMADWLADQIASVSLHSANPNLTGANQILAPVATDGSQWTESNGVAINNVTISFPAATSDLGTATHFTVRNSSNQILGDAALVTPRTIANEAVASFAPGQLRVRVPA